MTAAEIESLSKDIIAQLDAGVSMVGLFDPALIPAILIGRAVSNLVPGLAGDIARWVEGNPPTDEEKAQFREKLNVLLDPNLP